MTETLSTPATLPSATLPPALRKKGANVAISFHQTPEGRIMRAHVKHSSNTYTLNIDSLMSSHPTVAMQIFDMGLKTLTQNQINTTIAAPGNTPDDGEASMAARLAAWESGRYTSGVRTGGVPLFLVAFERALATLGKPADEIAQRISRALAEYRLEGDALPPHLLALRATIDAFDEDDEEQIKAALKLLRKHQADVRAKFLGSTKVQGNPLVLAEMDKLLAERAKAAAVPAASIDQL